MTPDLTREHFCTSETTLAEVQRNCSVLIDPNGPLASCLDLADPQSSYDSCVFDGCANPDPMLRERVISSYTVDCREEAADEVPPGNLEFREPELEGMYRNQCVE